MNEAAVRGLTLVRANNSTGFKGVTRKRGNLLRPFQAMVERRTNGNRVKHTLGVFGTPGEAALAIAKWVWREKVVAARLRQVAVARLSCTHSGFCTLGFRHPGFCNYDTRH